MGRKLSNLEEVVLAIIITASFGGGLVAGLSIGYNMGSGKKFDDVEQGFAIPSKVEIVVQNLDERNKLPETYIKYKKRQYALTLDERENPRIQSYEVIPAKIIPTKVKPAEVLLK